MKIQLCLPGPAKGIVRNNGISPLTCKHWLAYQPQSTCHTWKFRSSGIFGIKCGVFYTLRCVCVCVFLSLSLSLSLSQWQGQVAFSLKHAYLYSLSLSLSLSLSHKNTGTRRHISENYPWLGPASRLSFQQVSTCKSMYSIKQHGSSCGKQRRTHQAASNRVNNEHQGLCTQDTETMSDNSSNSTQSLARPQWTTSWHSPQPLQQTKILRLRVTAQATPLDHMPDHSELLAGIARSAPTNKGEGMVTGNRSVGQRAACEQFFELSPWRCF